MKITSKFIKSFKKLADEQRGVLSANDLEVIINPTSKVDLYRQIKKLTDDELITRVKRSFYVTQGFSPEALLMNLEPDSYLSLEYALARYNMIGTYSKERIRPICFKVTRDVKCDIVNFEFKSISKSLNFGIEIVDGIRIADKEKALLDVLYFYQKGTKFYFDIYSDIDCSEIDYEKISKYLKNYKNPKFQKFAEDFLND